MRRPDVVAILQALGGHGSDGRPNNLDVVAYVLRVDGWWSFEDVGDDLGMSELDVLKAINRVSIAMRFGDRHVTGLVERTRERLKEAADDDRGRRIKVQPGPAEGARS